MKCGKTGQRGWEEGEDRGTGTVGRRREGERAPLPTGEQHPTHTQKKALAIKTLSKPDKYVFT